MGPGKSLFDAIFRAVGKINIIAEDLVGLIRFDYKMLHHLLFLLIIFYDLVALVNHLALSQ